MPDEPESSGFRFLRSAQQGDDWPWFSEHYKQAPEELLEFLAADGIDLAGKHVADVGCGDGIIDLGLVHAGNPARLVGFDLERTDTTRLLREAQDAGVVGAALPDELEFVTNTLAGIPARDAEFDVVVSWSTFEHARWPIDLLREMRRILKPSGVMFIQIWPLWHSEHGSHLWAWYPHGYAQFHHSDDEIASHLAEAEGAENREVQFVLDEYMTLNRITADELQNSILAAGMYISKFELMTGATRVTHAMSRYPVTSLGISGIKLVAQPVNR